MEEARQFRFDALQQEKKFDKRSIFAELASMEDTFFIMLKKFAEGIRQNAALISPLYRSGGGQTYATTRTVDSTSCST